MEEKEQVVEAKVETNEVEKTEEKVEVKPETSNSEKQIDRQTISRYIGIDKNLKAVYNTTTILLMFMILRVVMSFISIGDIGTLFKYNMTETTVLAILSIVESVFGVVNCVLACVYFSLIRNLRKGIESDKDVTDLFVKCKKFTKIISIVFTVFFAFEIGVLGFMLSSFEVGTAVYLSLVWSALFTFYAWFNLYLLGKLEQDIKASQNA